MKVLGELILIEDQFDLLFLPYPQMAELTEKLREVPLD